MEPHDTPQDDQMDDKPGNRISTRDYVDVRINDLKESINERFTALALNLTVAKNDADRRLAEMNEFRDQIKQERADFATREYVDQRVAAVEGRISRVEFGDSTKPRGG